MTDIPSPFDDSGGPQPKPDDSGCNPTNVVLRLIVWLVQAICNGIAAHNKAAALRLGAWRDVYTKKRNDRIARIVMLDSVDDLVRKESSKDSDGKSDSTASGGSDSKQS